MSLYRKWYCTCSGKPTELVTAPPLDEDEPEEPACGRCGAESSSNFDRVPGIGLNPDLCTPINTCQSQIRDFRRNSTLTRN